MSNLTVMNINNQEVVFENKDEKDEQVFCTSLDVAKVSEVKFSHRVAALWLTPKNYTQKLKKLSLIASL
ncbi:hypothetical protein WGU99_08530, partial [Campylobacter jejuni]